MIHLEHQVVAVVMKEIPAHARALAHPVEPDAAPMGTPINMVVGDDNIDGSVQLNPGRFAAAIVMILANLMNLIAGNS